MSDDEGAKFQRHYDTDSPFWTAIFELPRDEISDVSTVAYIGTLGDELRALEDRFLMILEHAREKAAGRLTTAEQRRAATVARLAAMDAALASDDPIAALIAAGWGPHEAAATLKVHRAVRAIEAREAAAKPEAPAT